MDSIAHSDRTAWTDLKTRSALVHEVRDDVGVGNLVLDGEQVVVDTPGDGPALLFENLPCASRDDLAIHLDLEVDDRDAAEQRLCDLGASVRERKSSPSRVTLSAGR